MYGYGYATMPFGKYRGKRLDRIPLGYLRWCLANIHDLSPLLRGQMRELLDGADEGHQQDAGGRERSYPPPADLAGLITQAHRELTRQYHPDRGGDVKVMQGINLAFDRLKELAASVV